MELANRSWLPLLQPAPLHGNKLANLYDRSAPTWAASLERLGYQRAYAELLQRLHKEGMLSHLQNGSPVLDNGIGTAALSLSLTQTIDIKLQLYGVDLSLQMLNEARAVLDNVGITPQLYHADAQNLRFADQSFDLVMSAHMLEHLEDPRAGVQEMMRVLRPGSPLLLFVTRPGLCNTYISFRWRYQTIDASQLMGWLYEAGARDVQLHQLTGRKTIARWLGIAITGYKL